MKYAQLIVGLLAGTALGSAVVAATGSSIGGTGALDKEAVKQIVRDVIMEEPKLILDSVQKMQLEQMKKQQESRSEVLKDEALRNQVFNNPNAGSTGPKDSQRVLVEFFDYNCGACKMMYKSIDEVLKKDAQLKIVFHEYPIFGPQSEANSRIGIAVNRLAPEKYFDFHVKMISHQGRVDEKVALGFAKGLGLDPAKVKAEAQTKEVAEILESNRKLGEKLQIQGTPTLVIGHEIVPHALTPEELEAKLSGKTAPEEAPTTAQ